MKNIQECAKLYKTLLNKEYIFTLENDYTFSIVFKQSNFYHLTGLHKLTDIRRLFGLKTSYDNIYKNILSGKINYQSIEKSIFYERIKNRIEYFETITDMLNKDKSKIIIDFDRNLVDGTELINTKYILYRIISDGYANLTIGENQSKIYPETFFVENSKKYISEQTLLDIKNIEIIERKKEHIKQ